MNKLETRDFIYNSKTYKVPLAWSDTAARIGVSLYLAPHETSIVQLFTRVVDRIVEWGRQDKYWDTDAEAAQFAEDLFWMLWNQEACFNSPVLFNIGRNDRPQYASACFILPIEDTLESILDHAKTEGMIFKAGAGAGTNYSSLRGKGAPLSGGGYSSGAIPFIKSLDSMAGSIKSAGRTRRAARLNVLNIDHPDIEEFITCKVKEEEKAKALLDAGFSGGLTGDAYQTVAFQNSNNSVMVTDDFMTRVVKGDERESTLLMDAIAEAAWKCGDPGMMFYETINRWNTCPKTTEIIGGNPCAESLLPPNFSCNLASINLVKVLCDQSRSHFLGHIVGTFIMAMDIIAGNAEYPGPKEIAENARKYRPLGLGVTNLGAYLMRKKFGYGTPEGRTEAQKIFRTITSNAWYCSYKLRDRLGTSIPVEEAQHFRRIVLKQVSDIDCSFSLPPRNSFVTCAAPCGTIGILMDSESSGIEPLYALEQEKTTVAGDVFSQKAKCAEGLDPKSEVAKTASGINPLTWQEHLDMVAALQPVVTMGISKTINTPNNATVQDIRDIYIAAWKKGLKAVSIYRDGSKYAQPLTTKKEKIELPEENEFGPVTPEEFEAAKESVIMVSSGGCVQKRMPPERSAIVKKFKIGGKAGYITAGMYPGGRLGEIFIEMDGEGSTLGGLLNSLAIITSTALQFGVPINVLAQKMMRQEFEPRGFTGDAEIKSAKSVVDFIFRWLLIKFGDQSNDTALGTNQIPSIVPSCSGSNDTSSINPNDHKGSLSDIAETGKKDTQSLRIPVVCSNCGHEMIPTGTCHVCSHCGTSGGCS